MVGSLIFPPASSINQTNPSCEAILLHPVEVIYGDYLPGVTLQTAHEFSGGTRRGPDDAKTGASELEAELSCHAWRIIPVSK